jgi:hypothetical protein
LQKNSNFTAFNPFKLKKNINTGIRAILPVFGWAGIDYGIRFDNANDSSLIFSD